MTLDEFEPLTPAERAVIAGLGTGHVTVLGDGTLPGESAGEDRRVRASLIRWLALDAPGDDSVRLHERGLGIKGALVVSDGRVDPALGAGTTPGINFAGCTLDHDLVLFACRFCDTPIFRNATVHSVALNGAALPGLKAEGLDARNMISLRDVQAKGEVKLLGARIGSDLACEIGSFENTGGKALSADGLEARGNVFLRGVLATGEVRLVGARIGGNLDCEIGSFKNESSVALVADSVNLKGNMVLRDVQANGEVRLIGARIGGNLSCLNGRFENAGGHALSADGARVTGVLFWRKGSHATGVVDLTAAEIGHINDDPASWPGPGDLLLNRCRYGAFVGHGISGADRIRWLDLQAPARWGMDFWPQPWEHCAQVLREMGHTEDARQVLIAKERRQRAARRARRRAEVTGTWTHAALPLHRLGDWLLGALIAYGHRPLRAVWWLAALWIVGAVLFGIAFGNGTFKPNNAFILAKDEWAQCEAKGDRRGDHPSTLACYRAQPEAKGYPAFNAPLYSLDTLLPVVDLEVQDYWVPDARAAPLARWYLWAHIAAGWALTLLAVAGFSGLVQSRASEE